MAARAFISRRPLLILLEHFITPMDLCFQHYELTELRDMGSMFYSNLPLLS